MEKLRGSLVLCFGLVFLFFRTEKMKTCFVGLFEKKSFQKHVSKNISRREKSVFSVNFFFKIETEKQYQTASKRKKT